MMVLSVNSEPVSPLCGAAWPYVSAWGGESHKRHVHPYVQHRWSASPRQKRPAAGLGCHELRRTANQRFDEAGGHPLTRIHGTRLCSAPVNKLVKEA